MSEAFRVAAPELLCNRVSHHLIGAKSQDVQRGIKKRGETHHNSCICKFSKCVNEIKSVGKSEARLGKTSVPFLYLKSGRMYIQSKTVYYIQMCII